MMLATREKSKGKK